MTLPETIRSTTANGAKYWAVALPDGDYKWYAVPRTVGTGRADESQLGITVETYVATGRFIFNESGERAEIYELQQTQARSVARSLARQTTMHETIEAQLMMHLDAIVIQHHGGTVTLTPEQARQVLAGRELVDVMGKAVVK